MIEKGKDVIAVGAIGRSGHAQIKPRRKVRHDGLVTLGSRAVGLVDDDVVELVGPEFAQMLGDRRAHGKHAGNIAYILAYLIGVERIGAAQEPFIACARGVDNAPTVRKKEDAPGFGREYVERRKEGFACACG